MLQSKNDRKSLKSLYSLYSVVIKISFRHDLKGEEIETITSVMGTIIFSKEPLNDEVLIIFPEVKSQDILQFIQNSLISIIDKDCIFHFYHHSFKNFILSSLFSQDLSEFAAVQDWYCYECQFAMLYLNTIASLALHFNIYSLKTLDIRNRNILAANKLAISPLLLYSCWFWADYLVCIPYKHILIEVV